MKRSDTNADEKSFPVPTIIEFRKGDSSGLDINDDPCFIKESISHGENSEGLATGSALDLDQKSLEERYLNNNELEREQTKPAIETEEDKVCQEEGQ